MTTAKLTIQGMDGLRKLAGQPLGQTDWKVMTFDDILRFADATGDHQWIHVDKARIARESPYKVPIAHGYFALALVGGMFFDLLDPQGFGAVLNYGLNKVRFPGPLKEGARYRLSLKLAELKDIPGGVDATVQASIDVENETKPACAVEMIVRFMAPA